MTSFLWLLVDKVRKKFRPFVLFIASHLVRLVASGVITREINNEQALDFGATWCDASVVPLRSYFIFFPNLCLLSIHTVA
jgi:hypothetical protein